MEKHRPKKERFSLFGPRSSGRSTNPPSSSSSSSTSAPPIPPTLCKTDPHPSIPPSLRKTDPHPSIAPSIPPGPPILSKTEFLEAVRCSNQACQRGQYSQAVQLYGKALSADPQNCILYSNRSAAHLRLGQYQTALDDALKARLLNPKWPKAYFRQGVALQYLGRHADALAAFASGLAQDPKSLQLLVGMVEAAMKSPLRDSLEPTYQQLQRMKLDKSPFVVVCVIGQELLTAGYHGASVVVLEAGLKIGTCSLKLRGSVFSALSSAYWSLGNAEKSTGYMQQDLEVAKTLGDQSGECRAHGNLGSAYFSKGNYREALTNHRHQLVLAMKLKDREAASSALSSLGHVYTAIADYPNALASHKQCVLLAQQTQCPLSEARQLGNMGAVYTALGDFTNAVLCHQQHLDIAKTLGNGREEARAYSNLGSAHHSQRDFDKAVSYHTLVLQLALELEDRTIQMRAYAGLGHAARCMQDLERAGQYHQQQLDIAEELQDRAAKGRASSNLGIIHQMKGEYDAALKLHNAHLCLVQELGDYAAQGRAYGNMGNAFNALGMYDQAVRYHRQELHISLEVNDRPSQASTHGNLAVAYQALGAHDRALQHYLHHLTIARELRDTQSTARALGNLGNFHCCRGEYVQAVPYYQQYLTLSPQLQDLEEEGKVCHNLAYTHYCLGQYRESVRYYEQDLALAKDLGDKLSQAKAYCNLGLAYKALGEYNKAEDCQRYLLSLAQALNNTQAVFRALGNLGDVCVCRVDVAGAVRFYQQQLTLAQEVKGHKMEADAYSALGSAHRLLRQYDLALSFHQQELSARTALDDQQGQCGALGRLAAVHMALTDYATAFQCYQAQLTLAQGLRDARVEAQVQGNMGIAKMNMGVLEEAIGYFEQQLAMLEQLSGVECVLDRGRAYGNLADCYDSLGDFEEAIKYSEMFLTVAQSLNHVQDQERAYRGLGNAHRSLGSLQQALVCFEKRLVVAHELGGSGGGGEGGGKAQAYGELGDLHSQLGNYEQALSCLEHQLNIACTSGDRALEGEASAALGAVYQLMGENEAALQWHQSALEIAEETGSGRSQGMAYGNMGLTYEALGNYEKAVDCQEQHLSVAAQNNDLTAKTLAYGSLGRTHHALQNYTQAVMYLQEGLRLAEQCGRREEEAKIRHRLGLSLWASSNLEEAQHQLYRASALFESIRHEAQLSSDYRLSLFDLQTSSYQALQRVLVSLGHYDEALAVAERGRTRAFADLLVERQQGHQPLTSEPYTPTPDAYSPVTIEHILDTVNSQKSLVLYFSLASGYLYSWLLAPGTGIVKFHEVYLGEGGAELQAAEIQGGGVSGCQTLEQHITAAREALGVDTYYSSSETENEAGDLLEQQFEERLTSASDPTDCLHSLVSRNNVFSRSGQSLSSLVSSTVSPVRETSSSLLCRPAPLTKPPLRALHHLLIAPMEEVLMPGSGAVGRHRQLVLVLEGELYLVPFALLKGSSSNEYLYERFNLLAVPSIGSLGAAAKSHPRHRAPFLYSGGGSMTAVVGAPRLPSRVMERWLWGPLPSAHDEALRLGELLGCQPLTGTQATKERVLAAMSQAECVHFATHVSWKLAALVLSPSQDPGVGSETRPKESAPCGGSLLRESGDVGASTELREERSEDGGSVCDTESVCDAESVCDSPPLQDFLLTAADILDLRLPVKLVVLGSYQECVSRVTSDGVVGLSRAFLTAGVQCVCVSLWPVPMAASKVFTHSFYTALLNGTKASAALSEAMKTLQSSTHFSHPSNWAGFMLIGCDVKLNSPSSLIGQALAEILQYPERARDALRVILHLVEKSLQRIQSHQSNAMYTSQQSVENKVGGVPGWQALLSAVGFRLDCSGTGSGLPAAVFFPTADPGDRLQLCSSTLQSLLGLPHAAFQALCKLVTAAETGDQLINKAVKYMVGMLHQVLFQQQSCDKELEFSLAPIQVSISVQLWRLPGCHEFLAALGFDLCEAGQEEVLLKTGKQASRRTMHFALQSLLALFDSTELPKRLSLDSSSSLESLSSSQCASHSLPLSLPLNLPQPPFSPPLGGADGLSCDAISLYSLSSLTSSLSFLSRPEPAGSDVISQRSRQQELERHRGGAGLFASHRHTGGMSRNRLTNHRGGGGTEGEEQEEYEGFSIISSEPLGGGGGRECDTLPLPGGYRHLRGAGRGDVVGRGYPVSVSSKGSVSTPTSPLKVPPPPLAIPPSPNTQAKSHGSQSVSKGQLVSTEAVLSESDQSSTETDSTVKSQEDKPPPTPLDPQELASRILSETQSHMQAVESLQRGRTGRAGNGGGEEGLRGPERRPSCTSARLTPAAGGLGFRSSETSAFSRPSSRASLQARASPLSPLPSPLSTPLLSTRSKPPSRSSSLQKISSGYNSPTLSSRSPSLSFSHPNPSPSRTPDPHIQAQLRHKYPSSPYTPHISHSPNSISISPSSGHPSPVGSFPSLAASPVLSLAPSPALSFSSTGSTSARSSPAETPDLGRLKRAGLVDERVQAIHNLKTFWSNATQRQEVPGPGRVLRGGGKKMSTVQKDVLGLLHLSPRHGSTNQNQDTEGPQSPTNLPDGHKKLVSKPAVVLPPHTATDSFLGGSPGAPPHPVRLPSGKGFKFPSPGKFFPSSKC
ncbi:tetratricopeptide repeat protein 28-like isoform X1 [Oncorhynchus keta]|uniref:tetratricopeptide repeat protein 28-like isoform X1 n=2 Tax=Oncorhynchus keta TaxID=8018 RepID=UPI00227BCC7E|nr:tetratricopeptide repeat protein 28-like isoform X1 [Oncorhynchus keta]